MVAQARYHPNTRNRKNSEDKSTMKRYFTKGLKGNFYDTLNWVESDVKISDNDGKAVFEQKGVQFPDYFSELGKRIVSSKYFYGEQGTDEREYSFKQLIGRITETIAREGVKQGYITKGEEPIFRDEIAYLMTDQRVACNSPVQFNVGTDKYESRKTNKRKKGWIISDRDREVTLETDLGPATFKVKKGAAIPIPQGDYHKYPQSSACFIQKVEDTMEDIMRLAVSEAMLFKQGSGTGTDLSTLRSSREKLSGGGKPSGPLKYLRFYDRVAAIVKSGGKTRRAAKMDSLRVDHPDIKEFINAKREQESIIRTLVAAGMNADDASEIASYQNANLSIRATDEFMHAVENNQQWKTHAVNNKELEDLMPEYPARELFSDIGESTYECGDPGLQFDSTINRWHTCPQGGRINASNPCSEYMFIDDSSCNLASHRLTKYINKDGSFDIKSFIRAIQLTARVQDLLFDFSSFPERTIAENSHKYRPLGMGYADLGSLVMQTGLSYDSDEARCLASAITSLMTASVYEESAKMAQKVGAFEEFENNRESMLKVIEMHRDYSHKIDTDKIPQQLRDIKEEADRRWESALRLGRKYGFRNAQATVLAPTGTIGFMMDCDTTGIEPDVALVKYKLLAGGGLLKLVNRSVPGALKNLGYDDEQIKDVGIYLTGHQNLEGAPHIRESEYKKIIESKEKEKTMGEMSYNKNQIQDVMFYLNGHETIEGAPHIKEEHLPVFDCAFKAKNGKRNLSPESHLKMMAAVQPFISGAISKTINVNKETTPEKIEELYMLGWKLGLKAVAIYRDDSKTGQPLSTGKGGLEGKLAGKNNEPYRRRLPDTRNSITHKFSVSSHEGYLTVGLYEDKTPGELFITMAKEGSTVGGLMDVVGTCISMSLQYGVPLPDLCSKFRHARFEPSGMTSNKDIPFAKSLIDYIFTWLEYNFIGKPEKKSATHEPDNGLEEVVQAATENNNTENSKKNTKNEDPSSGKLCMCGNVFQPRFCGDICPHCRTPDYSGCEGKR
jgi:ribonucleoside-diphosphate reductase alpha chain